MKKLAQGKNYRKVRVLLLLSRKIQRRGTQHNEIPAAFYNGSNYDYHFTIKQLAKESEGRFEWLGESTKTYKTFSVSTEKEITKVDKEGNENIITISFKVKKLLLVRDLWHVHYQILLIISQKEFTKLNVKIVIVFLNIKCQ